MEILDRASMLLRQKGSNIFSLPSDASVYSALEMMADKRIGALLVVDGGKLVGIVSERDYARKVALMGKSSKDTFVREIMTASPITIGCDTTVEEAMALMTENRVRHLPVTDADGNIAGILSIGDLVNWVIKTQHETITHLEHYIAGDLGH